jgi:hypothetical protein
MDEAFRHPRAVTIRVTKVSTTVSIAECSRLPDGAFGPLRASAEAFNVDARLEPSLAWLDKSAEFWVPLTDYERIFTDRGTDGSRWWFEFAGPGGEKAITVLNLALLVRPSATDPRIRDVTRYFELVDQVREALITAGLAGWKGTPAKP